MTEQELAEIRARVAAWGRDDDRALLAEVDRLLAAEELLRDVGEALHSTDPGVWPGIIDGAIPSCFGCRPVYRRGEGWAHTEACPIGRALVYVAAKNTTAGGG